MLNRRIASFATLALSLVAAVTLSACADGPAAPASGLAAQSAQLDRGGVPAHNSPSTVPSSLLRSTPLARDITAYAVIGPTGGELQIPEAGMKLEVPAGAVQAPTVFRATALAGSAIAYDFGPSGSFPVALTVKQDLKGTNFDKQPVDALIAAYVPDISTVNRATGTAKGSEPRETTPDRGSPSKLKFTVTHFSGYMVSTGRSFGW